MSIDYAKLAMALDIALTEAFSEGKGFEESIGLGARAVVDALWEQELVVVRREDVRQITTLHDYQIDEGVFDRLHAVLNPPGAARLAAPGGISLDEIEARGMAALERFRAREGTEDACDTDGGADGSRGSEESLSGSASPDADAAQANASADGNGPAESVTVVALDGDDRRQS